jgi:hypothetical protein
MMQLRPAMPVGKVESSMSSNRPSLTQALALSCVVLACVLGFFLLSGCATVETAHGPAARAPGAPITVCIDPDLPHDTVMRAVGFWRVPVQEVPVPPMSKTTDRGAMVNEIVASRAACNVHVSRGPAPVNRPDATGYVVGDHDIVYVGGAPVWYVVEHEFGHILDRDRSDVGIMAEW